MIKICEKNYQTLTAKERIKLTIAALARHDTNEAAKLRRTCPKKTYIMYDHEYIDSIQSIIKIAAHFSELRNHFYHQVVLHMAFSIIETDPEKSFILLSGKQEYISCLKCIYKGFEEFCNEVGLNIDHLMKWFQIKPLLSYKFIFENEVNAAEEDQFFSTHIKKQFFAIWTNDYSDLEPPPINHDELEWT